MDVVKVLLMSGFVAFVMVAALAVWGVRVAKRGVERWAQRAGREVRRAVSDAALTARAAQPGVVGEAARTRKELRSAIDSTRSVLLAASVEDPALRESLTLLDQLHAHASRLDGELAALTTGELDRGRIAARLPELRARSQRLCASADSLRFAAQERAQRHDAEALDALHQQVDIEAEALRHWTPAAQPAAQPGGEPGREPRRSGPSGPSGPSGAGGERLR